MRNLIVPAALIAAVAGVTVLSPAAAEDARRIPAAAMTGPAASGPQTAIFAGGCFWGVQGVFAHVKGVTSALSGYAGGAASTAHYEEVGSGTTGHAESVKVTFDPARVSYAQLLQVYFSVVTDPTTLDYQGPDHGPQYRSALFPTNDAQRQVAAAYIAQLDKAHVWKRPIVTRLERIRGFYPAEGYHQNYLTLNPDAGYIVVNDMPKVAALKSFYPNLWRAQPVLAKG